MTFFSSFLLSLINLAGIWSCSVAFLFINLLIAISVATFLGGSTDSSAVFTHIIHCHWPFHLPIQSASHNIQTTFQDFLFVDYYVTFLISNQ